MRATKKIIFLRGLPGSGKTTWAKKKVLKSKDEKWLRVNKDDIRNMLSFKYSKAYEEAVNLVQRSIITAALFKDYNVIVDNTGFNTEYRDKIEDMINYVVVDEVEFEDKFFDTPLEECIERDSKRDNPVGEKVIRTMYNKYLYNGDEDEV